jgi:N12 class adenine-specific DNA methylase
MTTTMRQPATITWLDGFTPDLFDAPAESEPRPAASAVNMTARAIPPVEPPAQQDSIDEAAADCGFQAFLKALDQKTDDPAQNQRPWLNTSPQSWAQPGGETERIAANIAAIELAQALEQGGAHPTADQAQTLLRYSGWGSLPRLFVPDGATPSPLATQRERILEIVGQKAYEALRASTTSAFFTPPSITSAMWAMIRNTGFAGGRVLEPAAGCGHMLATMPADMAATSEITAIEPDPVSAKILRANFAPFGVRVQQATLEKSRLVEGYFDLVVGNPPYGDFPAVDVRNRPYSRWTIHNWFLAKSLELVRPGGLVAVVTSRYTLDAKDKAHREWLATQAELLAAIRLPAGAFETFAGTQAVTDILLFRRRQSPAFKPAADWLDVVDMPQECMQPGQQASMEEWNTYARRSLTLQASINGWYAGRPHAVLGQYGWESSQYGKKAVPRFDGDSAALEAQLMARVGLYQLQGVYATEPSASALTGQTQASADMPASGELPGTIVLRDDRIWVSDGNQLTDVDSAYSGKARERVLGMMAIRDATRKLIAAQADDSSDAQIVALRSHLNRTYDTFVARNGPLMESANMRIFRSDPDWPVMASLEVFDNESDTWQKADIFRMRTVGHRRLADKADTVGEALALSLAEHGRVSIKDIAARMRKGVKEAARLLKDSGLAFRDPVTREWVSADQYLSGDVQEKLAAAETAGADYEANASALRAVLPEPLGPGEIDVRLGASWVPLTILGEFASLISGIESKDDVHVTMDTSTATYSVVTKHHRDYAGSRTHMRITWGTPKRSALDLLEEALNGTTPKVTMTVNGSSVTDHEATASAREKWGAIREHFKEWAFQDPQRCEALVAAYNDKFNRLVPRRYDGSHLHLPGMSMVVTPRQDQKNAIWRTVSSGTNVLLGHCVGAGKTLIMAAAGMELRRLGRASKILHVVLNSTLDQYAGEILRLYPQARVLIARKEDLSGDNRRAFVARVAAGDWDAIVMTQPTFERLALNEQYIRAFCDEELAELRAYHAAARDSRGTRAVKEIEKRIKWAEARMERLIENRKKDPAGVTFEELGVDWLFMDEAHVYKSLDKQTKDNTARGLGGTVSQRAMDFYMKSRWVMRRRSAHREEGVVAATGTFIANSISDLWAMQTFLQRETLKRHGIAQFDAWIKTFAESVNVLEPAPEGGGYRTVTRYAYFSNVPELMKIFGEVADIKTSDDLKLPVPPLDGGKVQVIAAPASDALKAFTASLVERAARIRGAGREYQKQDNMLKIATEGRAAAVDMRLVDPLAHNSGPSKLDLAAQNIHRIWQEGHAQRHVQLVFSDIGTPSSDGFNVYDALRNKLIELGIPRKEIEFVHDHDTDARRRVLFRKLREGVVRVCFGSTSKLGTGVDVPTRLRAGHHLDVPYRPCDVEQRDGRPLRQGNRCEAVGIYRYVTTGSMDEWSWNIVDTKARFIAQLLQGRQGVRRVEDVSATTISYAELKALASGNPVVMEKARVDVEVLTLTRRRSQWEDDRWLARRALANYEQDIVNAANRMPKAQAIAQAAQAARNAPLRTRAGATVTTGHALAIGTHFLDYAKQVGSKGAAGDQPTVIAELGDFELLAERLLSWEMYVRAKGDTQLYRVERPRMQDVTAVGEAALATIEELANAPARLQERAGQAKTQIALLQKTLASPFAEEQALRLARERQNELAHLLERDRDMAGAGDDDEADGPQPTQEEAAQAA